MGWQDRDYAQRTGRPHGRLRTIHGPPWLIRGSIVTTLIAVNVAIYLLQGINRTLDQTIFDIGSMQAGAVLHGQIWRLFSSQSLHGSTGHLLINMLVLHFLGRPLERMWTVRRFFTIYTLCGLFGNIFYTLLGLKGIIHPLQPAVGASGCIYGLLGIVAVLFPTATVYVYFLFPLKIRTAAMIFGGIAILSILGRGDNFGGEACHLAGLVFGVWWAAKGDAWWSSTEWRRPKRPRRARSTGGFQQKIEARRADVQTIDGILKKVHDKGIHSLTDGEKRALTDATERQKERERGAGRIDRL